MVQYDETIRNGLIVLKLPPYALQGSHQENGKELEPRIFSALDRGDLLIDVSAVDRLGEISEGLRSLMKGRRLAQTKQRKMLLAAPRPVLLEKLMMSRFQYVLPIFATLDEAIEAYATGDFFKAIDR